MRITPAEARQRARRALLLGCLLDTLLGLLLVAGCVLLAVLLGGLP